MPGFDGVGSEELFRVGPVSSGMKGSVISGGKGAVREGGIRVPLIVRGPGIAADSWCRERVVGFDLFATFGGIAGVKRELPRKHGPWRCPEQATWGKVIGRALSAGAGGDRVFGWDLQAWVLLLS
jgi:arylsulfatase A-like enzyme